jgi:hypothetical protein
MLNTLFEPADNIEIRCLHKDQVSKSGRMEPPPQSFWGNIEQLRARNTELQRLNSMGYNIYFGINPREGNSRSAVTCCRALVVDIDHMDLNEATSWLEVVEAEWCVPAPSVTVSSGNGVHFYWRLAEPLVAVDWHKYQKALIATFNLSGKIADPVIHDAPRIMRLPGFVNHKGGNIATLVNNNGNTYPIEAFAAILENLAVPAAPPTPPVHTGDNENALERALKYHEKREGAGEGARNAECYKIAACCQNDFGLCENDTYHVIYVWNQKNSPPLPESEIREVIAKAKRHSASTPTLSKDRPMTGNPPKTDTATTPRGETVPPPPKAAADYSESELPDRNMAGVDLDALTYMVENYVLVAGTTDVWDLEHGIKMPVAALSLLYPMEFKYWKTDGCRKVILPDNLVFEPSGVVADGQINTFQGFKFSEDSRPIPLMLAHLEYLCGDDDSIFQWVISWMALQVQQPGTKIASSIIMHGKQGTGKSMIWECFGRIFDPYFTVIDQCLLESDFNAWASRKLFVLAEEVLANQSKSRHKNIIKQMITGGEIMINEKQIRAWREKCYMNLVFNSNNRLPMLLDEDDRRFMVIRCDRVNDEAYYTALAAEIADNGPARLYTFLKAWDLQGFNAHSKPLLTEAKKELMAITRDTCKVFLDEWLANEIEGLPCGAATRQDLYDAYSAYCRSTGLRCNTRNHLYSVIDEDYLCITYRRNTYQRYFEVASAPESNPHQFREALGKFIGSIQDRRI